MTCGWCVGVSGAVSQGRCLRSKLQAASLEAVPPHSLVKKSIYISKLALGIGSYALFYNMA